MSCSVCIVLHHVTVLGLGIFGLQSLALLLLFLINLRRTPAPPAAPSAWPTVTVQLPVFNERYVVGRLLDSVCALDYEKEALSIQVLDDSTDETAELLRRRVSEYRDMGVNISLLHRENRSGFKGGALAAGLRSAPGELIAVFDADFAPAPDFLRRLVPYLAADPKLGMVQARWTHRGIRNNYTNIVRISGLKSGLAGSGSRGARPPPASYAEDQQAKRHADETPGDVVDDILGVAFAVKKRKQGLDQFDAKRDHQHRQYRGPCPASGQRAKKTKGEQQQRVQGLLGQGRQRQQSQRGRHSDYAGHPFFDVPFNGRQRHCQRAGQSDGRSERCRRGPASAGGNAKIKGGNQDAQYDE